MKKKIPDLKSLALSAAFMTDTETRTGVVLIGFPAEEGIKPVSRSVALEEETPFPQGTLLTMLPEVLESAVEELVTNYWHWVEAENARQEKAKQRKASAAAKPTVENAEKASEKKTPSLAQTNFLEGIL
ncbi:hypothetical protein KQH40_00755 [bacterium]|nr:hypothetical protein [bacterium]